VTDDDIAGAWAAYDEAFVEPVTIKARPFIKWVGGKTQLLPEIEAVLPETFTGYFEPFIGGGAVFFHLANQGRFKTAKINDFNPEISRLYGVIKAEPHKLMAALDTMASKGFTREVYNEIRAAEYDPVEEWDLSAARTIYLNKTGFNGLYRQNKKGEFNAPWGKRDDVTLYNRDVILACSEALQNTAIETGDFALATHRAGPGSVVYMDPPYVPLTATSDFKSYTSEGFTLEDQKRVAATFKRLVDKGVHAIVSNSDTEVVRDLYQGYEIRTVMARRAVNSQGDKRGPVPEVLVLPNKVP
jgi:DNA adenine methylase